jgi:hypothetical protein
LYIRGGIYPPVEKEIDRIYGIDKIYKEHNPDNPVNPV